MGKCLKIDLNKCVTTTNAGALSVSFGMNQSDGTTGWTGLTNGYTIYPVHQTELNMIDLVQVSPISLDHKMIPTITFQNQKRIYKGTSLVIYTSSTTGRRNYVRDCGFRQCTVQLGNIL